MSLSSFTFIPELNYWMKLIAERSPCQQKYSKISVQVLESEWRFGGSILELLFNLTFSSLNYSIFYKKISPVQITDRELVRRIALYATRISVYLCEENDFLNINVPQTNIGTSTEVLDDSSTSAFNIFSITEGEKEMLDMLLLFKTGNQITISDVNYQSLSSSLSKLIYIFLIGEIENDYSLFNQETPISNQNRLLEIAYEKWLLDHVYKKQSLQAEAPTQENFVDSEFTSIRRAFSSEEIAAAQIRFPDSNTPISSCSIYLVYDGQIQILDTDYTYKLIDGDPNMVGILDWNGLALKQKATVGDNFYLSWSYAQEE